MSQEYYKMGEKKIPVEQVQRAGKVFDASGARSILRKRKRRVRAAGRGDPNDKLHKMADWYRPKE